jgi:hypothetical protein
LGLIGQVSSDGSLILWVNSTDGQQVGNSLNITTSYDAPQCVNR